MVSSALDTDLPDLLDVLEHMRQEYAEDPEYQELRSKLPADWPM